MADFFLDSSNFEKLFRLHFANLTGYVYGFVKSEEAAKDIVHDAFLTLWNNRGRVDTSYSLKAYLFTLSQNYALNYLRHRRVVVANEREIGEWFESAPGEWNEYEWRLACLAEKLPELPEKQREVLHKCIIEGKKYKEVAEELGVSPNTVKTHITRALKFLRDEIPDNLMMLLLFRKKNKKS